MSKRIRYTEEFKLGAAAQITDSLDYIELYYNPKHWHANNGVLSPLEFEMAAK